MKEDIEGKIYKKHDLKYSGNIDKNLSKQFYKNSKYHFRFTGISLKIGFLLMVFMMIAITYYSMNGKYNQDSKYKTYDIQGEYITSNTLNEDLIEEIKDLEIEDLVSFRKETVSIDLNENRIVDSYKETGSLSSFEENITSLDSVTVELYGIEDEKFKELVLVKGLNPDKYVGNKVILLNTLGDKFDVPVVDIENIKFLKDHIKELDFSEYDSIVDLLGTKGYEFTLNIEDKIDSPLFAYPIKKNFINLYMPKSEYLVLLDKFVKLGNIDQVEYISIKTDNVEEVKSKIHNMSLEYFKEDDFHIESKFDEEIGAKKRNIIGSILSIYLSLFFIVVGFSNCYFSFYNLFLKRRDELLLYKAIGMDENLLKKIFQRERRNILINFIISMPFIILGVAYFMSKLFKIFRPIDFLLNLNYLFVLVILGYVLIIYIAISKMYNNHSKEIIKM